MKWIVVCLLLLPLLARADLPEVKVRSQLLPADSVLVGGTLSLQVDVLVDTWFSAAPRLPRLGLDGAVVSEPGGEATHLNERIDGKPFFGLRFTYQITPQQSRAFEIPPLDLQVEPAQGSGPVTVHSSALSFVARQPTGASDDGEQHLVARQVEFTQELKPSHQPLRVGDSVVRLLHIKAQGAQAMLIPPPAFVEVEGLKRYVQTPVVAPLGDGRGSVDGGMRDDSVTYVVTEPGEFTLPSVELHWWDAASGEPRISKVAALDLQASADAGYRAPFSITDDLRALGQKTQLRIARHWLVLLVGLLVLGVLGCAGRFWGPGWIDVWKRWRRTRRQAWLESPEYAWRQVRGQLEGTPPELGALYLWIRRTSGCREMRSYLRNRPVTLDKPLLAFFRTRYGRGYGEGKTNELVSTLPSLQEAASRQAGAKVGKGGLKPLNP
ncbi:hypothetical protein NK553_20250 [Pseudomonas sp. ZM23]|uniref:Protein BatD n=1 Tax=Pseudomonas triclosanedens TaxID=2961893 RepID=A0ABY7A866_9PSED|nr:hypothetical protein [Pseudomonas triclosanedens]MCP8466290.1 hypothetical protein [Pseudomonas triclosanedens]MCP8471816.1 hypothetical protein [Pseudomonas triclosanedens]MCP8478511.1 hypothetical protein [Pseudomonas triclosanedens]WAI52293.1 hypothetical protein OU419_13900 [Pseudomonas triclosanedens]